MISNVLFSLEISTRDHRWIGFNTEHTPVTACNYNIFVASFLTRLWSLADQGSDTALSAATGCFCPPWPWPTWTTFLTSLLTLCWSTSSDNAESREGVLIDASWDVFIGALPKQSADNEQKVFLRKRELFTLIITSTLTEFDVGSSRTLTLVLGTSRDIASISETNVRSRQWVALIAMVNLTAIIWYILLNAAIDLQRQLSQYSHWFNIFHPQIIVIDPLIFQNILKIIWDLYHVVNLDCRRKFAFGGSELPSRTLLRIGFSVVKSWLYHIALFLWR